VRKEYFAFGQDDSQKAGGGVARKAPGAKQAPDQAKEVSPPSLASPPARGGGAAAVSDERLCPLSAPPCRSARRAPLGAVR
jgi:hypothetical protein